MKQLTLRDIVKQLRGKGYSITFKERSDRGIRITSINGVKFKDSKGNVEARKLAGIQLSQARAKQLSKIGIKKGTKRDFVSEETRAQIKEINRLLKEREKALKKKGTKANLGRIRLKNFREARKQFGEAEALAMLGRASRYASGLAYTESIEALVARLRLDAGSLPQVEASIFNDIANELEKIVKDGASNFHNEYLQEILNIVYEREKGAISTQEMRRRIMPWINAGR